MDVFKVVFFYWPQMFYVRLTFLSIAGLVLAPSLVDYVASIWASPLMQLIVAVPLLLWLAFECHYAAKAYRDINRLYARRFGTGLDGWSDCQQFDRLNLSPDDLFDQGDD